MANIANTLNPNVMPDLGSAPLPNVSFAPQAGSVGYKPDAPPVLAASLNTDAGAMPDTGHPMLAKVIHPLTPMEQNIQNDQQQLQKVRWAQQNPWGTANNHPGIGGKIAHVLSTAGQIAGDIFAPSVMALAPGTNLNRDIQEGHLTNRLNEEQQEESQNEGRDATTAHTQAETDALRNPPNKYTPLTTDNGDYNYDPKTGAVTPITGPDGKPLQSKAPNLTQAYAHAVDAALKAGRDPHTDPVVQQLSDAITGIQPGQNKAESAPKTIQVEKGGKPHQMAWDPATKKYDLDQGESGEKPVQGPAITMVVPDPNGGGGGIVERLRPGQPVAPGAMSATQFGSQNTPTTQQRNVGAQAALVHEQTPQLINQIDQLRDKLGPLKGNWNAFMQGKVGLNDPDMADLRANLLMYSSAVALMHARGRLPENLREEFDHAINAPNQTPENLKAIIHRVDQWTSANASAMHPGSGNQPSSSGGGGGEAPEGFRVKMPDGSIQVKQGGKWVKQ